MTIAPEDMTENNKTDKDEVELTINEESLESTNNKKSKLIQKKNYETNTPLVTDGEKDELLKKYDNISISALPDSVSKVNDDIESTKEQIDITEESRDWFATLLNGFRSHPANGMFENALSSSDSEWRNVLTHNGQNINIGRPKFSNKGKSSKLTSERLTLSIRARLGLGSPIQIPLPASGFYVTIKPLGEDEIIALWREIIAETVKLGRVTHGLIFSNNQSLAAKAVCEAWRRSIFETTVHDMNLDNIFEYIKINDLPVIAQSLATSIYPNGFPLTRAVFTEDTNTPKEEISQVIDIRKCLFMNNKAFSDSQLEHMTKRIEQPMSLKSIKAYTEDFKFNQNSVIDISDDIKLHLHTPSLKDYFDSGEKWINDINTTVSEALGAEPKENERLRYISQLALSTRLRQFSHYVKAVEEDGELYSTRENIDKVLIALSTSEEISKKFYSSISDYINNTQVAIVATTSVNEYEDVLTGNKWPRLIAMDAVSVFFQLVEQKLLGITSRVLEDTSD